VKVFIYAESMLGVHYATNLELASKHLDLGDEVHMVICHGSLKSCLQNSGHDWKICIECKSTLRAGLSSNVMARAKKHVLNLEPYADSLTIPDFSSIDDLRAFSLNGINHGIEAASSVVTFLMDPRPDMQAHRAFVRRTLFTSVALYRATLDLIDRLKPDVGYLLNGRYASQRPVLRALQQRGIRLATFEVGHSRQNYSLIEGTLYHDLENKKRLVEAYWEDQVPRAEKERIAHKFFRDRCHGSGDEYPEARFTRNQRRGVLPAGFDATKRNIAIFNSSEDEFAAVEGYENLVYKDQIAGLRQLICSPNLSSDIRFYLRVHPRLGKISNFQTRAIEELRSDNLVVVGANDDVDTYALMESAEQVVTFGSSMGIESAYAGRPSILIGRADYEDLGACYKPRTHADVLTLINNPQLPALPKLGALKYGYYMVALDVAYEHFDPKTNAIHGNVLMPSTIARRAVKIIRAVQGTIARRARIIRAVLRIRIIRAVLRPFINPVKSLLGWDVWT
jgi:hypothetical protein